MIPTISITPRRAGVAAGAPQKLQALVTVRAPHGAMPESQERPRLNLAIVIDRSGSMSGQPLEEAKSCARRIVEQLTPEDRLSIVVYDNRVDVIQESVPVMDRQAILARIDSIRPGGTTNLHGGWLEGAKQVADHLADDSIGRVILLSDGVANAGLTDPAQIRRQVRELALEKVTTSTYGLGRDFNEDLMTAMADEGEGTAYYGETAADLMPNFEAEFGLLSNTLAKSLRLRLCPSPGVAVAVANRLRQDANGTYVLPNLVAGAESWALVEMEFTGAAAGGMPLLEVELSWQRMDGTQGAMVDASLVLPALDAVSLEAVPEGAAVVERVKEVEAACIQERARDAARRGDWGTVDAAVGTLQEMAGDNAWLSGMADELGALSAERDSVLFSKETAYASTRLLRRYVAEDEDHRSLELGAQAAYLAKSSRQGRTKRV